MNKTCKDCIYFDKCGEKYRISTYHGEMDSRPTFDRKCTDFKDKSSFIELPCAAGDTVYYIVDIDNPARRMLECKIYNIDIDETRIKFYFKTVQNFLYRYGSFKTENIGKTVFLTKEEAEKALGKEDEGK